jgi:Zn-dependent oligopeptidase
MGCRSYSDFMVKPNMASSPDVVMSFLLEMSKMIKPKADEVLYSFSSILVRCEVFLLFHFQLRFYISFCN